MSLKKLRSLVRRWLRGHRHFELPLWIDDKVYHMPNEVNQELRLSDEKWFPIKPSTHPRLSIWGKHGKGREWAQKPLTEEFKENRR